jgi:hypothetical protein
LLALQEYRKALGCTKAKRGVLDIGTAVNPHIWIGQFELHITKLEDMYICIQAATLPSRIRRIHYRRLRLNSKGGLRPKAMAHHPDANEKELNYWKSLDILIMPKFCLHLTHAIFDQFHDAAVDRH